MKIWSEAFKIWKNYCSYLKRELITKSGFLDWAKDLKLVRTFQDDDFLVFINFLEEADIIHPLTFCKYSSSLPFNIKNYSPIKTKEFIYELYHPIQFFELLNWFNHASVKGSPYYISENFQKYFSLKKHQYKIKKAKKNIKISNINNWDSSYFEDHLKKLQSELSKFPNVKYDYSQHVNLLKYMKIGFTLIIFSEEILCIWIKIETLMYQKLASFYGKYAPQMRFIVENPWDKYQIDECVEKYNHWREKILKTNKKSYLDDNERDILKKFHFFLGIKIREGNFGVFGNNGNWIDLFDVIDEFKLSEISGMISYYINLMFIRRYIERTYWDLFKKNILYDKEQDFKPYFVYENKKEWESYLKRVKVNFGLSNPFVLYVEGATEKTILEGFIDHFDIKFQIVTMQGISNTIYYERLCRDSNIIESFFFFDVHTIDEFNKMRDLYGDNCSFFFPDFVTENFSIEEFYNSFLEWIDEIQLNIENSSLNEIKIKLEKEKELSNKIIYEFNENGEILVHHAHGFEDVIITYLKNNYSNEIVKLFPDRFELIQDIYIRNLKDFKDFVKTGLAHRLKVLIIESFAKTPSRSKKFRFEAKLEPFYKKINIILNSVPNYF